MPGRKIRDERDALDCLARFERSGLPFREWLRRNDVDGRSLQCWRRSIQPVAVVARPALEVKPTLALREMHERDGFSVLKLATRLGLSPSVVHAKLTAEGAAVRPWHQMMDLRSDERIPSKAELHDALGRHGHDLERVAAEHGMSVARVRAWLDRRLLVAETGTRLERYLRGERGQEALVAIDNGGALVMVDGDLVLALCAHRWQLDAAQQPVTRVAGHEVRLAAFVLGLEPGSTAASALQVGHVNGNVLDCRRANLITSATGGEVRFAEADAV